jgi:hypothetical protein
MNNQEIRAFVEAVYGTDLDTVLILALDAVFGDDECHVDLPVLISSKAAVVY